MTTFRSDNLLLASAFVIAFAAQSFGSEIEPATLNDLPRVSLTATGLHGDPINVAIVGTRDELIAAMVAAHWQPADPITFTSSAKLVKSVVLHRPDPTAPVSNLYIGKRKEDLAFEQEVGKDASRRHHVRFWESSHFVKGRTLWLGAATFDTKVGFSHKNGMITHHIDANIDADRDKLLVDLTTGLLLTEGIESFQAKLEGRNGGGDPFHTDGKLLLGVLKGERHN